ncbi:hypothetical protein Tsubulata_037252 [Turnera subulata]|uniref:Uncharacterized protein n=1 Tax=Turnera subulata TaxID=218843 RepID=A0A9Q0GBT2_9ROSI|nr:hypothetical protein Tsubulata_037252 [Turnera subulata]
MAEAAASAAVSNGKGARSRGRVVTFNDKKGYGFIKPDEGDEDLFVHHTAIVSDGGFRTLSADDIVEFDLSLTESKYQAVNVTKPGGDHFEAKKPGQDAYGKRGGGGFGGSWNRRNNGGGGGGAGGCYNCNGPHLARDCPNGNNNNSNNHNGGGGGACYNCGEPGHFARDCKPVHNNVNNNGGSVGACYSCGGAGHLARNCLSGGGGGGGGGAGDRTCYNCGGFGHIARNCGAAVRAPGGRRFGGNNVCFHCGGQDHFARDCTNDNNNVS